jgi:hypothetical protein
MAIRGRNKETLKTKEEKRGFQKKSSRPYLDLCTALRITNPN